MILFEIHKRFKGHFFNELRFSFKLLGVLLRATKRYYERFKVLVF